MNLVTTIRTSTTELRSFNRPARLFLLAIIFDGIMYSGWSLFFNFYILERGFSKEFLGLANAVPSAAILLTGLPMGMLSDRIGRKRSMVIGLILSTIFLYMEVSVADPALILIAAFLANVAGGLYFLSQAPFMMRVSTPENRALLFSLNAGLLTLAGAFGNVFAGQLPALFGGWLGASARSAVAYQAVLLVSISLGILTLVPILLLHEPSPGQAKAQKEDTSGAGVGVSGRDSLRRVLSQPLIWKLTLPNLGIGLGASLLIPYLNVFLVERFHISDQALGALFGLSALLTGIGSIAGPRLVGPLGGKIRTVVFTQSGSLAFLLLLGFSPLFFPVAVAFLMRATLMNMAMPLYSAFAMEQVSERQQGIVNSVKELGWQGGYVVGTAVSGLVQQSYGFSPLFAATALLYALATGLTWAFFHKHSEPVVAAVPGLLAGG